MPPQGAAGPGAASLEDRVGLFDSIGNSIDSLVGAVKAIPKVAKEAAYYTYYTAKPLAALAGMYLAGGMKTLIHASVMAGGFMAGKFLGNLKNKEKTTYKQLSNEGTVGAIMGGFLSYIFKGAHYIAHIVSNSYGKAAGIATKAAASLISIPVFMTTHEYTNRALIGDYKPKTWQERKKEMLKTAAILGVPVMANFAFVPLKYNIPAAAGINTAYGYLRAEPKKEEAPAPYGPPPGYTMPKAA